MTQGLIGNGWTVSGSERRAGVVLINLKKGRLGWVIFWLQVGLVRRQIVVRGIEIFRTLHVKQIVKQISLLRGFNESTTQDIVQTLAVQSGPEQKNAPQPIQLFYPHRYAGFPQALQEYREIVRTIHVSDTNRPYL